MMNTLMRLHESYFDLLSPLIYKNERINLSSTLNLANIFLVPNDGGAETVDMR